MGLGRPSRRAAPSSLVYSPAAFTIRSAIPSAEPSRLPIEGADRPNVFTLRTFADSKAIIADAAQAKRAVVVGAGFIGLEAAASLRERGVAVDVVAFHNHVTEIDADSQAQAFAVRHVGIAVSHPLLNVDGGLNRPDDARKLC